MGEDTYRSTLGRAIAAEREARGLTQKYVADWMGTTVNTVWDIEHGRRDVGTRRMQQLELALGLQPGRLYELAGERLRESAGGVTVTQQYASQTLAGLADQHGHTLLAGLAPPPLDPRLATDPVTR